MPETTETPLVVTLRDEVAELAPQPPDPAFRATLDELTQDVRAVTVDVQLTSNATSGADHAASAITWIGVQLLQILHNIGDIDAVRAFAKATAGHAQRLVDVLDAVPVDAAAVADRMLGELPDPLRCHIGLDQNTEFHLGQWRNLAEILIEIRRLVELAERMGEILVPDNALHLGGTTTVREAYTNALVKTEPLIDYAAAVVADHVSAPAAKTPLLHPDRRTAARPSTVTLCGSMRFFPQMLTVAAELTDAGVVVLAPFRVVSPENQDSAAKARLDELHRRKIDMADRIVVVTDESRYVGDSTRGEIDYATRLGKPIDWAVRPNAVVAS
ncbi:hypothetical protein [Nocardia gipuzkoensis]